MNKKGFILYDGLVSLILLTSFIIFVIPLLQIIQVQKYYYQEEIKAINKFRTSIYNYYNVGEYIHYQEENIYSEEKNNKYCLYYKQKNDYEKICT